MRSNIVSSRRIAGWNSLRQDMTRRRRLLVRKSDEQSHDMSSEQYLAGRQMMVDYRSEIADQVD